MSASHCPGQDRRYWTPEDITLVPCPACGEEVELFKDEGRRRCVSCGTLVKNPRVLLGCASWCAFAEDCVGTDISPQDASGPADRVIRLLKEALNLDNRTVALLYRVEEASETAASVKEYPPLLVKIAAVMATAFMTPLGYPGKPDETAESEDKLRKPEVRTFILKSVLDRAEIPKELVNAVKDAVEQLIIGERAADTGAGQETADSKTDVPHEPSYAGLIRLVGEIQKKAAHQGPPQL